MQPQSRTLIASLIYALPPAFRFADLLAEVDHALTETYPDGHRVSGGATTGIFEVEGARITLAIEDHCTQPADIRALALGAATTLVLSIGPSRTAGPSGAGLASILHHRFALLSALAERILQVHPAVHTMWTEITGPFSPQDFAPLIGLSAYTFDDSQPEAVGSLDPDPETHPIKPHFAPFIRQQMDGLQARFRSLPLQCIDIALKQAPEMSRLPMPHVTPNRAFLAQKAATFANSQPDLPQPLHARMQKIWAGLHANTTPAKPARSLAPLPQRLTIYTMNTTLMLISLPIGSAILVYNMIRGEDVNFSARAIALSGTVIGIGQLVLQHALTPFI